MLRSAEQVASFEASGIIFKDTVEVISLEDPKVEGATLYLSDFKRSLGAKLATLDFITEARA